MKNIFGLFMALVMLVSISACGSSASDSSASDSSTTDASTPDSGSGDTPTASTDPAYFGTWITTHTCATRVLFSDAGCSGSEASGWTYEYTDGQAKFVGLTDNCTAVSNFTIVGDNPWTLTSTIVSQNENCPWTVGDVTVYTLEVEADGSQMKRINQDVTTKWLMKPYTAS